jgi:hypothetical protein
MTPKTLKKKCQTIVDMLEQIKSEYKLIDDLMGEVVAMCSEPSPAMSLPDGYMLIDEFQDKEGNPRTVVFRATAFRRFKLVVEE